MALQIVRTENSEIGTGIIDIVRVAQGSGPLTLGLVWILIGLFTLGQSRSSHAHHARNDFDNIARWVVRMFQEGVSMLLGLGVVTALAWLTKGDGSAAALTALSAVLAVSFQLFACCVHASRKGTSD